LSKFTRVFTEIPRDLPTVPHFGAQSRKGSLGESLAAMIEEAALAAAKSGSPRPEERASEHEKG
jgi:hypothetical protein